MANPSILFVCLGNICRSPLAEGIFRQVAGAEAYTGNIASAGIGGWHVGNPPDRRSIAVARKYGIDISAQRARQVSGQDFGRFDLILAMDRSNLEALRDFAPTASHAETALFSRYTLGTEIDVPDPYYGGDEGFETVYSMLFSGSKALLEKLGDSRFS